MSIYIGNSRWERRLLLISAVVAMLLLSVNLLLKKSTQEIEAFMHLRLHLPEKPTPPQIEVPDKQAMFDVIPMLEPKFPLHPNADLKKKLAQINALKIQDEGHFFSFQIPEVPGPQVRLASRVPS